MNNLRPFIEQAIQIARAAFCIALFGAGFYLDQVRVQAEWNAEKAARAQAENAAILTRMKNNERVAAQQETDRILIEKAHHDELAKVRADIAPAPGLRVGPAICGGSASATATKATGGSDGADSRTRLLSTEMDRDIKALIEESERAAATARACQALITQQ